MVGKKDSRRTIAKLIVSAGKGVNMTKKIVLLGGYGGHNGGDEAILTANLNNLKRFISDAEFLALSSDPPYTSRYHEVASNYDTGHYLFPVLRKSWNVFFMLYEGLKAISRGVRLLLNAWLSKKAKKTILLDGEGQRLLSNLSGAALLFNVGGGGLNSLLWPEVYLRGLTFWVCKILGKPVILSGQTIGPFNRWLDKKFAKYALNKVDVITLRDASSSKVLKDLGVTKPLIKVTADDAVLLPHVDREKINSVFLSEKIELNHPLVGVNILGSQRTFPKIKMVDQKMAQVADLLISELGATIVFVPMEAYYPTPSDIVAASKVLELMEHKDKASLIMNEYDARVLKGIIGQLDLAIGFRYHFIVFATTVCVPAIGIYYIEYYRMKIKGIMELMEQDKYVVDLEKASPEQIIELAREALSTRDSISQKLEERTRILGERSLFAVRYAAELLRNTD